MPQLGSWLCSGPCCSHGGLSPATCPSLASVIVLVCAPCFPSFSSSSSSSSSSHVPPLPSCCFKGTVQPKTKTHCVVLVIHLDCFSASFQPQLQWNQTALSLRCSKCQKTHLKDSPAVSLCRNPDLVTQNNPQSLL